jgi:hypothetical protein
VRAFPSTPLLLAAGLAFSLSAYAELEVVQCDPLGGALAGGTRVWVFGSDFESGATVKFDTLFATDVTFVSSERLDCTTPAHAAGLVNVTVTNPGGGSATLVNGYTYATAPTISDVSPDRSPGCGGTKITITGSGFQTGATVYMYYWGSSPPATDVVVFSSTKIFCTTPPEQNMLDDPSHEQNFVDLFVENPDGQYESWWFMYEACATVWDTKPDYGTVLGGTGITITGHHFGVAPTITFGGSPATNIVILDPDPNPPYGSTITCQTPAHAKGAVNEVLTFSADVVWTRTNDYTYLEQPTVSSVTPSSGTMGGNTTVTVAGTNFSPTGAVQVTFDDVSATNVTVLGETQITCKPPAHPAGTVDVRVINPDGQSGTLPAGYAYAGYEGDTAPRSTLGNEDLTAADLIQARRFVAGLDTAATGPEFQRADIAPKATGGDANLTADDLSQARRYLAGLDSLAAAGGPTQFAPP